MNPLGQTTRTNQGDPQRSPVRRLRYRFGDHPHRPASAGRRHTVRFPHAYAARRPHRPDPGEALGDDLAYLRTRCGGSLAHVATMADPATGRVLKSDTTAPAMLFYPGDYLDGTLPGTGGGS